MSIENANQKFFCIKPCPPALRLAAMTTQQPNHHNQSENSSWPMEARMPVVMMKEALGPLLLQNKK